MFKKGIILFLTTVFFITLSASKYKILIIESYHSSYSWDKDYISELESNLSSIAEIDKFQMDTKRIDKSQYQNRADKAWKFYKKKNYDLVVLGDDNALKFLGKKFQTTNTPVVFLGINNNPRRYFETHSIPNNFSGVLERPLLKRSIIYLKEINPKIKNLLVLFDNGSTAEIVKKYNFDNKEKLYISGIDVDIKLIKNYNLWKKTIVEADKQYDAIIIGLYHTLKDGNKYIPASEVLKYTNKKTKIMPFAFWEFTVGKEKAIGGYVLSGKAQGKKQLQL